MTKTTKRKIHARQGCREDNNIGESGARMLSKMLTVNTTLTKLDLAVMSETNRTMFLKFQ